MILKHPWRVLAAGLALGWLFDLLFYGKLPGISLLIFSLALLAALGGALCAEGARAIRANLWLPTLLLFFAAMGFVRANAFLTFLNICAMLMLASLLAIHLTRKPAAAGGVIRLAWTPIQAFGLSLWRGGGVVAQVARQDLSTARGRARRLTPAIVRGLLIALPVVVIFGALLASADLIFADLIRRVFAQDILEELLRWGWHGALILAVGFLALGGLAYTVGRPPKDERQVALPAVPRFLGFLESAIVINAVNVLFVLYVLIQLRYLFGGQLNVAAGGHFTYAEYARRGFGELMAVSILALGMVLALNAITQREGRRQGLAFNISSTILVALTCVMLASAFKRLLLYEDFYGFTEMRLYSHVFMVWLGLLLAWFVATLWLRPDRFAIGLLIAAFGFIATLDLINPEAFIVRQNFARYQLQSESAFQRDPAPDVTRDPAEYARIDASYLAQFSDDAVPALIGIVDRLPDAERQVVDARLLSLGRQRYQHSEWRRWQSFHLARWNVYRWLAARYDEPTLSIVEERDDGIPPDSGD